MIFITKVHLKNFQSHKNTELEFHRGLNVIVGHSDSGKTAIIRAIKWAIYNEPLGDYFLRQGENEVSVTLTFNTGTVLKRYKKGSKNAYYLKKSDGEEYNFDGFGTKVPKEITDEIKMSKINLDEKSSTIINIAEQLEGPFLLNEKGSVRASAIGRLVGVNYIDDALRETIRDSRQININLKNRLAEKEKIEENLKKYDYLDSLEDKVNKLKDIKSVIDFKTEKMEKLKLLKNKYDSINLEIDNNTEILKKYDEIELFAEKINVIEFKTDKLKKLSYYGENYNIINDEVKYNENIVFKLKNIEKTEKIIEKLKYNIQTHIYLVKQLRSLQEIEKEINQNINQLNKYNGLEKLENINEELNIKLEEYYLLYNLYSNINNIEKSINIGNEFYKKFKNLALCENTVRKIDININLLNKLIDAYRNLSDILLNTNLERKNCKTYSDSIKYFINEYNTYLKNLGYCPVCLSKIDRETINHIEKHFKE